MKQYVLPRTPIYKKIEQDLRDKVQSGYWLPGAMLPSRKDLATMYDVGLPTLKQAIVHLLADGTLRADERKGTFVADRRVKGDHASTSTSLRRHDSRQGNERKPERPLTLAIIPDGRFVLEGKSSGDDWVMVIIRAIEQSFCRDGGAAHYYSRYNQEPMEATRTLRETVQEAALNGADAIVLIQVNDGQGLVQRLGKFGEFSQIPIIIIPWLELVCPLPQVVIDNFHGGYIAASHLLAEGYRSISFLGGQDVFAEHRLTGVKQAVEMAGLPPSTVSYFDLGTSLPGVGTLTPYHVDFPGFDQLVPSRSGPPPGIIAATDPVALGVISHLEPVGLRPGRDFGLVSFDDSGGARQAGLTTLHPPLHELGAEAARLCRAAINSASATQLVRVRPYLVVRASTRRHAETQPLSER